MADYKDIIAGTISNIVGKVKEAAESPSVQQAVGKVKEAAGDTVTKVKEAAEGSTVKEVYEQGASKVRSYSRMARLSLQLNGEQEELRRVYTEIGKLCYSVKKDEPEEFFAPLFSQVEEISARISSIQDELDSIKAQADEDITVEVVAEPVDDTEAEFRAAAQDFQAVVDADTAQGSGETEDK